MKSDADSTVIRLFANRGSLPGQHEITRVLTVKYVTARSCVGDWTQSYDTYRTSNEPRTRSSRNKFVVTVPYGPLGLKSWDSVRLWLVGHTMRLFQRDKASPRTCTWSSSEYRKKLQRAKRYLTAD